MGQHALDPDTEFQVVRSETPVNVDGFKIGEPTGEIECCSCGRSALNIDEIPHRQDCDQRWARTDFWRERFLSE
ncbi:hypothetical protein CP556_08795 [Natrinema sp. CBA1119]|uniref:hypothetical protein n=1 Tax=Natrinema sp. CBA1119 TaxID=1608465 RepID=UPI000BF3EAA2|nr:hypothetical protein [Natrinema sp. CBA1119]PGF16200.1 hypothetical protein CP556_08795 [Natrinema sp. CBA1119]